MTFSVQTRCFGANNAEEPGAGGFNVHRCTEGPAGRGKPLGLRRLQPNPPFFSLENGMAQWLEI